jgi:glycine/D-amino acid oxidase-like deaminating enzyme
MMQGNGSPDDEGRRMDLKSGYPWWVVSNGLLGTYPALREDVDCDVLVMGAGITGALIADELARTGLDVCVVDRREAGWGSTAASTALLQYEIDVELQDLARRFGLADALLAYRSCAEAIPKLLRLAREIGQVGARPMRSLYYASRWYHERRLRKEAALRQAHGFRLKLLEAPDLLERFGFDAPVGLLSEVAAVVDPYRMAHRLLARVRRRGGRVHDRTAVAEFAPRRGGVVAKLETGATVRCKHLVIASGYEGQAHVDQRVARNRSSYAFITDPVPEGLGPLRDCVLWESARPYLYARSTPDGRLLVGGEDDRIDIATRRDAMVMRKAARLRAKAGALFPRLTLEPAFAWAGTFAETADGLPFFGAHAQHGPRVLFAMAYGGNGITYSQIGAELLRETIVGRRHPCARLFSFDRLG